MHQKSQQSGRSLVETLAVLAIIAILTVAGLLGYSFVLRKYQEKQTVKQVVELGARYNLNRVKAKSNKQVLLKDVYPEAEREDAYTMITSDQGRVSIKVDEDVNSFSVVVDNVRDNSCREILASGGYDAVKFDSEKNETAIGSDYFKKPLSDEEKKRLKELTGKEKDELIESICTEQRTKGRFMSLIWGGNCPKSTASYLHSDGKCWFCPDGEKEDKRGKCCSHFNECGYCEDTSDNYCLTKPSICHNQLVCDANDSKQCVECTRQSDCDCKGTGLICSNKHCCPEGQQWNGKWCACPKEKEKCGTQCCVTGCSESDPNKCKKECKGTGKVCQECDDSTGEWITDSTKEGQEIQDVCHMCQNGEIVLKEEGKDTIMDDGVHCCADDEKWLENRCCRPSDSDESKCAKECTTPRPDICHQCDDATGEWVPVVNGQKNGCFECIDGVPQDISDSTYPCDTECETCNHTSGLCEPKSEGTACDGDVCRQCDGRGSCVLKDTNLPYTCGTKCCKDGCSEMNPNECKIPEPDPLPNVKPPLSKECHKWDDSIGKLVPLPDGTVPEGMTCKWCQAGVLVDKENSCPVCQSCGSDGTCISDETQDDTECGACSTCKTGVCSTNGTECGTQCCANGCNPADTTQCKPTCNKSSETDCKKCNDETGLLENVADGTEVGCMQCVGGQLQEKEGACSDCQQCNTEKKSCEPKPDGTECQDVCHSCKAGVCQLTDPGRTHVCGSGSNSACCVYGCETRKKQKKWNLCRCPNGHDGGHRGDLGKADDPRYIDEYENETDHNRCDGCIWMSMAQFNSRGNIVNTRTSAETTGAIWTIKFPPKTSGSLTVLKITNGNWPTSSGADRVEYRSCSGGTWKELRPGNNEIGYSEAERCFKLKNVSRQGRKVEFHPYTNYF